jgi:hypothetical protein
MEPDLRGHHVLYRRTKALVLDWHRMANCCAGAGEASLYATGEKGLSRRKDLVRLKGEDPIYAARAIFPHLAGREIKLDARKIFGLRAVMGYLPERS